MNECGDESFREGPTERCFQLYEHERPSAFHLALPEKPTLVAPLIEHSQSPRFYIQDIPAQYRLSYEPRAPRDGDFHEIEVRASGPLNDEWQEFDVRVRARWRFNPR